MAGLSEAYKRQMQAKQQELKEKMASSFTKQWNLTGKQAIVEPGGEIVIRFGPRWDIVIEQDGKMVKNPDYVSGEFPIHVEAVEHWWDADGGKTMHAWCPKTLNTEAECPICVAAQIAMKSSDEDERKYGKRIQGKEVFVFNAVVGPEGQRRTADGKADFRIISVPGTVFNAVVDIMTGGKDESFARGNVGDHAEGYDLKLKRPAKGGNDRWAVDCAPKPTPLYNDKQKAAFVNWTSMLVNLDDMLQRETKSPLDLFKAFYGRDPEPDEMSEGMKAVAEKEQPREEEQQAPASEPEVVNEAPIEDEFMPGPAKPKTVGAPVPPKAGPKTGGRR